MNQLLLGASIPFLIGLLLYLRKGCRASLPMLLTVPLFMALGALWAIAPDLPRFIGKMDLYHRLAKEPRCNIFFWHYSIDKVESDTTLYIYPFIIILACLVFAALREVRIQEKEI